MILDIPPMSAQAFPVKAGQMLRITDVDGRQPGDFVAFSTSDLSVKFSQARTRVENGAVAITQGAALWTNTFPPKVMFTIAADMHGGHDLLYPPCCRFAFEKRFGLSRDGCLEHLARALEPWNVLPHQIPDPLNLFFNVAVDGYGRMSVLEPSSLPGSTIVLKAEMDAVVAISTCSVSNPAKANSEYQVQILDSKDPA